MANHQIISESSNPLEIESILNANHGSPFGFLGLHSLPKDQGGMVVRTYRPGASKAWVIAVGGGGGGGGKKTEMTRLNSDGFFEAVFPKAKERFDYQLSFQHGDDVTEPVADAYSFGEVLGEQDLYYFGEGTDRSLWKKLGARVTEHEGVEGVAFGVWAPNAWRVSVVGDFNNWDGRINPMRNRNGIWEIFLPEAHAGTHYKFEIVGAEGNLFNKSDPFAFFSQHGVDTASIVYDLNQYQWADDEWMEKRASHDIYHAPMSVYEVHLGSWKRKIEEDNRFLSYVEYAEELVGYVVEMGFTHIELMPVTEFPFDGSWGYQVCGYFSPTSRFGSPDEFRAFVDKCHQRGIGVIVDWVPAHFPKDEHGLARFDGTALYEHADPRQGEHTDWGTLIFNYGRNEVKNFLISNALFWLKEYHIDGLRVDAVASMLYLDYSREEGEWVPNEFGGRENLDAIEFIKHLNSVCYEDCAGVMMIAEESTAFTGVSRPLDHGGLGFGFKWNMGWMNDSLQYMSREPIHRCHHHGEATFSMIYAYQENYVLVLSHDEVVHGKGSLLGKMPGDRWQQLANLRMFYAWMFAHPGKKLLFQGCEFAQPDEWNHDQSIPWHLLEYGEHAGVQQAVKDLNHLYLVEKALHELDHEPGGFEWIDHDDAANSIFSFIRRGRNSEEIVVAINATPVPRDGYRIGVPHGGFYHEIFNSDSELYGGSNCGNAGGIPAEDCGVHGREHSVVVNLPPLATVFLKARVV